MSPFEVAKNIKEKGEILIQTESDEKIYTPYVVNKALSFSQQNIFLVDLMNTGRNLSGKMQYHFYYNVIPKSKKFDPWLKSNTPKDSDELVLMISEYFCINKSLAKQYLSMMPSEEVDIIKTKMDKGGCGNGEL